MKEDGEEMDDSDNEVEVGDGDKHVKRLNELMMEDLTRIMST